ncbi:MAG: PfkB family carbohydrate kinase [Thiobacillus sp.]
MNMSRVAIAMQQPDHAVHPADLSVVAFGETLVEQSRDHSVLGGAPFNVACHLGALGAHPVLMTRAGKDAPGEQLQQTMSERGLDKRGLQRDPARPTGRLKVTETATGRTSSIPSDQAYEHIHAGLARMVGLLVHPAMVYFGTLSQRGESRRALRQLLGAVDSRVFLDVNLTDPWVDADTLRWSLQQASVAKLNEAELTRVGNFLSLDGVTPEARARELVTGFGLERVVITLGASGAWTLDAAGSIESVAGKPMPQVVDTAGAGDGFAAVFILGTLRGWPLTERLARADAFARALCQIRGAVPAGQDFYRPFIHDWQIETGDAQA